MGYGTFEISFRGELSDDDIREHFPAVEVRLGERQSVLVLERADQAALHGVLAGLELRGCTVIEILQRPFSSRRRVRG
jgi:hypothetical protein